MFRNDYSELVHDRILEAICKYKNETNIPYGCDYHSKNAEKYILDCFKTKKSKVHFLVGGTQTNMTVISYILKDYEGVIACRSGHINVHETAAIEASGHKIFTVEGKNGKVYPSDVIKALKENYNEHTVKLKMVYISDSTEIGTIYTLKELKDLYECCKENGLYLFIDGARLGVALTSSSNDVKPSDIAKYSDVFYIGGTKNGMMIGEAVVINNKELQEDFRYQIKNKGAMLAKGYLVGIEFEEAFKDNLYFEIAENSNLMAEKIQEGLLQLGYKFSPSPTNQIFMSLEKEKAKGLIEKFGCELWSEDEEKTEVRIVTSFLTKIEEVNELLEYLK